ncbi:receptor-transporting protein 4-like isoform X1 [Eleutherodactylus coqui]|uniref:receptor-transporting protein 4-like isoform X1 n=2 Tax=Eleutherodactylus coqui TaxID=57060 RepID=UPI0034635A79
MEEKTSERGTGNSLNCYPRMHVRTWIEEFNCEIHESEVPSRWSLMVDENLQKKQNAKYKYFLQKTFGSFGCSSCKRSWSSSKVRILFRMTHNRYPKQGNVTMRIFKQGCQSCYVMQEPRISSENIKTVISNVVGHIERVFYGNENVSDDRPPRIYGKLEGPHDTELCEACQLGMCDRQPIPCQESGESAAVVVGVGLGALSVIALGVGLLAIFQSKN